VGRLGPKGRAEQAGSMKIERGPQGGCRPKCKRVAETILFCFSKTRVQIKGFK
jgi:hypothetical protein